MAGPSRKTWSWIWSAVSSQARTPMKASGVGSGSTPTKRTPAAVLRPTRTGVRGGNVQRFHDIGPTAWSKRLVSSRRVSRYRPGPASAPRPAGRSPACWISSRMIASSRTVGPTIVRPSARSASSNRSRSAAGSQRRVPGSAAGSVVTTVPLPFERRGRGAGSGWRSGAGRPRRARAAGPPRRVEGPRRVRPVAGIHRRPRR